MTNEIFTMAQQDARDYYALYHATRNTVYLEDAKLASRCVAELNAFRQARDSKWAIFLAGDDTPYVWFDAGTWAAWARLKHTANVTGRRANMYYKGDFIHPYGSAVPDSWKVAEKDPNQ